MEAPNLWAFLRLLVLGQISGGSPYIQKCFVVQKLKYITTTAAETAVSTTTTKREKKS